MLIIVITAHIEATYLNHTASDLLMFVVFNMCYHV